MPLRQKVILIVMGFNTVAFLLIYFLLKIFLTHNFNELELISAQKDTRRVELAINQRVLSLASSNQDYAHWDDFYNYMTGNYDAFPQDQLYDGAYANLNINCILIFDKTGKLKYSSMLDLATNTRKNVPPEIIDRISQLSSIRNMTDSAGVLSSDSFPFIYASANILKSTKEGPSEGTFIMVKILDQTDEMKLRDTTNINFSIYSKNINPNRYNEIISNTNLPPSGYNITEKSILHYIKPIRDSTGKTAFIIETHNPRDINERAALIERYLLLLYIGMTVFTILVTAFILDKSLLVPFKKIVNEVKTIRIKKDFSSRISAYSETEFQELSENINKMLISLGSTEKALSESNAELKKKAEELAVKTIELEKINEHLIGREIKMSELKKELGDLKGSSGNYHVK